MRFSRCKCKLYITSLAVILSWGPSALGNETPRSGVTLFDISPKACVAQYLGQECDLRVKVRWQSEIPLSLCFNQQKVKLKCWEQSKQGDAVLAVKLEQTTEFSLIDQQQNVVAKQNITMNFVNTHRRRLKPKWSIF